MNKITIYHYDAFSHCPNKGNPAGVYIDSFVLNEEEMQEIAKQIGFNETAFLCKSQIADFRIRYFTPGHEMNLCGHGTVALVCAMKERNLLKENSFTIETKVGILSVNIEKEADSIRVCMEQAEPQFLDFTGSLKRLADVMGIAESDIDTSLPIVYGSTGTWTLLVPIKKLETFYRMQPDNQSFPQVLKEMPTSSIHPFCFEAIHKKSQMHGRHFSSPYSGTIEDSVTGTASGVMGAYYAIFVRPGEREYQLMVEQGQEINYDGEVAVKVIKEETNWRITISGTAVFVKEMQMEI